MIIVNKKILQIFKLDAFTNENSLLFQSVSVHMRGTYLCSVPLCFWSLFWFATYIISTETKFRHQTEQQNLRGNCCLSRLQNGFANEPNPCIYHQKNIYFVKLTKLLFPELICVDLIHLSLKRFVKLNCNQPLVGIAVTSFTLILHNYCVSWSEVDDDWLL